MAARFHPDNPSTGSLERFLLLREAYQTLSDPTLRADYDTSRPTWQTETQPIFWQRSFVDGIEGENNRRLGVLSLLYQRRRVNESKPGISVMELERRMAFPREYLNFTLWYLRQKGYVAVQQDNSDYALTSTGVDFVESGSNTNKVIRELLTAGSGGEYIHPLVPPKVVPFPRTATRARVEGSRRILRRKQAGRR
jgi:curved DNA-binding protein CbpA